MDTFLHQRIIRLSVKMLSGRASTGDKKGAQIKHTTKTMKIFKILMLREIMQYLKGILEGYPITRMTLLSIVTRDHKTL